MEATQQPVIELDQLSKLYHTRGNRLGRGAKEVVALDKVSLTLKQGEIFGLVGESGSGKTTAGRLIVSLEAPSAGMIRIEGNDIAGLKGKQLRAYRRKVQMVFQDPYQSLNPQVSILDSVAEPLITNKIGDPHQREDMIVNILKEVGLTPPEDYLFRFPHQLSGGQRQRVAIARAMVIKPSCLVADEPTSMLDASYSAQIFEILLKLRQDLGTTILFITHSLASARYLCDKIAVIYHGRLVETGPARAVIGSPSHPYTQALIDATPKFGRCEAVPRFNTLLLKEKKVASTDGCIFFNRCARGEDDICAGHSPEWQQLNSDHRSACHFSSQVRQEINNGQECRLGT